MLRVLSGISGSKRSDGCIVFQTAFDRVNAGEIFFMFMGFHIGFLVC